MATKGALAGYDGQNRSSMFYGQEYDRNKANRTSLDYYRMQNGAAIGLYNDFNGSAGLDKALISGVGSTPQEQTAVDQYFSNLSEDKAVDDQADAQAAAGVQTGGYTSTILFGNSPQAQSAAQPGTTPQTLLQNSSLLGGLSDPTKDSSLTRKILMGA